MLATIAIPLGELVRGCLGDLANDASLFDGAIGRKPLMFWPQRYDGESNDDSDRDFKEPLQRGGPRRSRARDETVIATVMLA